MSGTLIHLGALPSRSEGSAAPESRATASTAPSPAVRPERDLPLEPVAAAAQLRRLTAGARIWSHGWVRKGLILVVLALAWQLAALWQDNDLLLPTFTASAQALVQGLASGELLGKAAISLGILLQGYVLGVLLALVFLSEVRNGLHRRVVADQVVGKVAQRSHAAHVLLAARAIPQRQQRPNPGASNVDVAGQQRVVDGGAARQLDELHLGVHPRGLGVLLDELLVLRHVQHQVLASTRSRAFRR